MSNIDLSQMITLHDKRESQRAAAMAHLADLRWQHETGGLTLLDGTRINTSRESQAQISSVVQSLGAGLIAGPVDWKMASGWRQVTPDQISAIAAAVAGHVKACFAAERHVAALLEQTPDEDLPGFDIGAAFGAALRGG